MSRVEKQIATFLGAIGGALLILAVAFNDWRYAAAGLDIHLWNLTAIAIASAPDRYGRRP